MVHTTTDAASTIHTFSDYLRRSYLLGNHVFSKYFGVFEF